ncbi:hypothetical protein HAX54_039214, partial [Datura stramonium]|nr:hypothetical protein [Datura stramonium]
MEARCDLVMVVIIGMPTIESGLDDHLEHIGGSTHLYGHTLTLWGLSALWGSCKSEDNMERSGCINPNYLYCTRPIHLKVTSESTLIAYTHISSHTYCKEKAKKCSGSH